MSGCIFRRYLDNICFSYGRNLQRCVSNVKYIAELQADIEEQIESQKMKPKRQPGKRKIGCATLPEQLVKAVREITTDFDRNMFEEAKQLSNKLFSRRPAIERVEYLSRAESLLDKKFRGNPEEITHEKIEAVMENVKRKLKQEVYRWKPIEYDEHTSKRYLIARLAPNFAVLSWVFSEIKQSIPSFAPPTFLDFGSGVGTAVWAAHNTWGTEIKEYFCVDSSPDMNNLAECLLKGGDMEEDETFLKNLHFRQFLPTSSKVKYGLVVSAFSMMELPSQKERLRAIDILWQKTTDTLVVIEDGSFAGYTMVLDARDYVLHIENKKKCENTSPRNGAYVVAPCPHDMCCPKSKLQSANPIPCNFEVYYKPLLPSQGHDSVRQRFSYVVLRKRPRPVDAENWPRVLKTNKQKRHVRCHLCCSDGELHDIIFTKAKNSRACYKCARGSSTGDLLPVSLSTVLKESQEPEEECQNDCEFSKTNLVHNT